MKVYSIGREIGCDIVINDSTDVISRRHAVLNVSPSGKMTIIDQSHNGTYVNGIRISSNVPVPVTRKDSISFAHVAPLNWDQIPNPTATIYKYVGIGVLAIGLVIGGIFGYSSLNGSSNPDATPAPVDTTVIQKNKAELEKKEKEKEDSIRNSKKKQNNTKKTDTKKKKDEKAAPKKEDTKKKEEPKKEEKKPGLRV